MQAKKLVYAKPELEVLYFDSSDIVTLSAGDTGEAGEDDFEDLMGSARSTGAW